MIKQPIDMENSVSVAKIENEAGSQPANFEDDIGVNAWRPTLQLQKRENSSTFHIPAGKLSHQSYQQKEKADVSDQLSPETKNKTA